MFSYSLIIFSYSSVNSCVLMLSWPVALVMMSSGHALGHLTHSGPLFLKDQILIVREFQNIEKLVIFSKKSMILKKECITMFPLASIKMHWKKAWLKKNWPDCKRISKCWKIGNFLKKARFWMRNYVSIGFNQKALQNGLIKEKLHFL